MSQPSTLSGLQTLLEEQLQVYETVRNHMQDKKHALITGDVEGLSRLDQTLLGLSQQLRRLEQERTQWLAESGHAGRSLRELADAAPTPAEALCLHQSRKALLRAVHDVAELNRNHESLIRLSLQWIGDTVETLAAALTPEGASYTQQGAKPNRKPGGSLPRTSSTIERTI